ncbi:MAG TPA: hypothetical protein DCE41_09155 [Cytophagales bacterium]|nr:hypothetical protein [Cytophagales bacterium]HAA20356.1 hypothetical protein [Cytophagales bacterium]HAP62460.1 hypothetical protein [Cytophagales bacterium]
MPGPFSGSEAQKSLEQNHALLKKERGYRNWTPALLKARNPKKSFRHVEASAEVLRQVQKENIFERKRKAWLTLARLVATLILMAVLWYGTPLLIFWLFPPL